MSSESRPRARRSTRSERPGYAPGAKLTTPSDVAAGRLGFVTPPSKVDSSVGGCENENGGVLTNEPGTRGRARNRTNPATTTAATGIAAARATAGAACVR